MTDTSNFSDSESSEAVRLQKIGNWYEMAFRPAVTDMTRYGIKPNSPITGRRFVVMDYDDWKMIARYAEDGVTKPLDDMQEDFVDNVAKDVSLKEFRVDL